MTSDKPVIIEVTEKHPRIVITDGFHFTRPIELDYKQPSYYHFIAECVINDFQLFGCAFILTFFYLLGFFTGVFILKFVSFLPVFYLLFVYYIDREQFIHIRQDHSSGRSNR